MASEAFRTYLEVHMIVFNIDFLLFAWYSPLAFSDVAAAVEDAHDLAASTHVSACRGRVFITRRSRGWMFLLHRRYARTAGIVPVALGDHLIRLKYNCRAQSSCCVKATGAVPPAASFG